MLQVSKANFSRIIQGESNLRAAEMNFRKQSSGKYKRQPIPVAQKLNELVLMRCEDYGACDGHLSDDCIRKIAQGNINEKGKAALALPDNFACSDSWLDDIKARYGYGKRKRHSEASKVSSEDADYVRKRIRSMLAAQDFEDSKVFYMDETTLFWRQLPSSSVSNS